jgi:NAD(P)-dependent dehydrogenase (short-subunit alcohol dehydrogenase family)
VRIAREVEERFGALDVLVNNAAVPGGAGDAAILDLADDLWYRTVDVNLNAVYLVTKALGAGMVGAGSGSIVNMPSSSWPPTPRAGSRARRSTSTAASAWTDRLEF